jgi:hypothetical protein
MKMVHTFEIRGKGWWRNDTEGRLIFPIPSDFYYTQFPPEMRIGLPAGYYRGGRWRGVVEYDLYEQDPINPASPTYSFRLRRQKHEFQNCKELSDLTYSRYFFYDSTTNPTIMEKKFAVYEGVRYMTRNVSARIVYDFQGRSYYQTDAFFESINLYYTEFVYRVETDIVGVYPKWRKDYYNLVVIPFQFRSGFVPDVPYLNLTIERELTEDEIRQYYLQRWLHYNNPNGAYLTDGLFHPADVTDYTIVTLYPIIDIFDIYDDEINLDPNFYPEELIFQTTFDDFFVGLDIHRNFQSNDVFFNYDPTKKKFVATVVNRNLQVVGSVDGIVEGDYQPNLPPTDQIVLRFHFVHTYYDDINGRYRRFQPRSKQPFIIPYPTFVRLMRTIITSPIKLDGLGKLTPVGAIDYYGINYHFIEKTYDRRYPFVHERVNARFIPYDRQVIDLEDYDAGSAIVRFLYDINFIPERLSPVPCRYLIADFVKDKLIYEGELETSMGEVYEVRVLWMSDGYLEIDGKRKEITGYDYQFTDIGWKAIRQTVTPQVFRHSVMLPHNHFVVHITKSPSGKRLHILAYDLTTKQLYEVLTVGGSDVL